MANFPKKVDFLFRPYRYKVLHGGRGSSKSWSVARALLISASAEPLRVLCTREVQNSIKQSVHQLLKDQVKLLGLEGFYRVTESEIVGVNGSLFSFAGLSNLTVDTIKSFEGYDRCWVEEGQVISDRSWKILIPTIRKDNSEIWITFNPDLDTDPTYHRFITNKPKDCYLCEMNWRDNPFFNDVLDQERLECKRLYPDDYDNIWEGKCRPAVEGAIYYKQIMEAESNDRIISLPYDPMLRVHCVFDLGWEDSLGCALVQVLTSEIRIIEYLEAHQTDFNVYTQELRAREYNWGRVWLPHDGFSRQLNSGGKSSYDILSALSWDVAERNEVTELGIEEGIRQTRFMFPRIYFDKDKVAAKKPIKKLTSRFNPTDLNGRLLEAAKRYRRRPNRQTDSFGSPLRDKNAHGADVLRYVALNADSMDNSKIKLNSPTQKVSVVQRMVGWMAG